MFTFADVTTCKLVSHVAISGLSQALTLTTAIGHALVCGGLGANQCMPVHARSRALCMRHVVGMGWYSCIGCAVTTFSFVV